MPDPRPTLLLTRPPAQSERFAAQCRARWGVELDIVISPVLTIRHRELRVDLDGVGGVIATSGHGIEALAARHDLSGMAAWCVGDRTAAVARGYGMRAVSAGGGAADLVDLIRRAAPRGQLLYARGEVARGDIEAALGAAGVQVRSAILYDQAPADLSSKARALVGARQDVAAPLFSPRSAALLGDAVQGAAAQFLLISLSAAVAAAWTGPRPVSSRIAASPDTAAMLVALDGIFGAATA